VGNPRTGQMGRARGLYQFARLETDAGDSQTGKNLNQCGEQQGRFIMGAPIAYSFVIPSIFPTGCRCVFVM
jgi:hypothetical protein